VEGCFLPQPGARRRGAADPAPQRAKISGPTVLARKDPQEVRDLLRGHGYDVLEVEGEDLPGMHHRFAAVLAEAWGKIRAIQQAARRGDWDGTRPNWPMIILRSPKGWTGPAEVDGVTVTGTWRSHQVPLSGVRDNPEHLSILERWLRSYRPEELFDSSDAPVGLIRAQAPVGDLRMSASPHANGGRLTRDLDLPDFRDYAVDVPAPAALRAESTRKLGELMRDIYTSNSANFRLFCPDETNSNRRDSGLVICAARAATAITGMRTHHSHRGRACIRFGIVGDVIYVPADSRSG
jgi:xylulose-5-phosphate/fructose-6-phosphate phosphoketolase